MRENVTQTLHILREEGEKNSAIAVTKRLKSLLTAVAWQLYTQIKDLDNCSTIQNYPLA